MNSFQVYLLVACTFPRSNEPSIWVIGSDDFRLKTFPTNHVFYTLPTLPHKYPFSMCTKKLWWLFLHIIQSWRLHIHFHVPNSAVSKSPYFQVKKTQHLRKLYILTDVSWFFPASHCQNDWTISTDHLVFHRQLAARSASVGFTWFHWVTYTGTSNTFKKINTAKHGKAECNTINYMKLWCISMDLFVMHLLDC